MRIAETEHGMLNSIGLQGPGIDAFVADHLPRLAELGVPLWVSVGGFSAADFALCCERLDGDDRVAAIELNLSCPNVEEAPETAAELVAAARGATSKALYAKLSPAQWDVAEAARAVVAAGADGLSLVNTIRGLALDPGTLRPRLARAVGGYSGPGLRPIALACVHACATAVDVPIVGMGGVSSGRDALELVAVGASAVALGTVLFADPLAPERIRAELEAEATALGSDGLRADRAPLLPIGKIPANRRKQYCLIHGQSLLDSAPQWSRRRRTPRHPPGRSTSGWKPSNVRTTSVSGVRS